MNIVITGASKGIGEQLVYLAASAGNNKIFAVSRNQKLLSNIVAKCQKEYPTSVVYPVVVDLTHDDNSMLVTEIKKYTDTVDILINNAGAMLNKPFSNISFKELTEVYSVNVFSPFILSQLLLPLLKKATIKPHIVNIGSMGGYQGSVKFSGLSAYSSSKGALAILTECMAEELKTVGISTNCLCLGAVETEMLKAAFPGYKAPVNAEQMAEFIFDFARNAQYYMNGKVIPVSLSTP